MVRFLISASTWSKYSTGKRNEGQDRTAFQNSTQ